LERKVGKAVSQSADRPVVGQARWAPKEIFRFIPLLIAVSLSFLTVEVMLEAWVQTITAAHPRLDEHNLVTGLPEWPKQLKNGVLLLLLGLALVKVALEGRWREFRSKADVALLLLVVIMVIAGLVNGASLLLIAKAVYVYLRGVIVFVAWRAWDPNWRQAKTVLWVGGGLAALNAVVALVQQIFGGSVYSALGWVDFTWASINRAQGLTDHPNNLGHILGLAVLGLLAWFVSAPRVALRWWLLFVLLSAGLAASQSRESMIGALAGVVLIGVLRRGRWKITVTTFIVIAALGVLPVVLNPANLAEWNRRWSGVTAAVEIPSGREAEALQQNPSTASGPGETEQLPGREIRVLFAQQGFRLLMEKPALGYGVGHFGGTVAYANDPNWQDSPRFDPHGFDLHGFVVMQVDSFWLHLVVEVGLLGLLAYLGWMSLLAEPALRAARQARLRTGPPVAPNVGTFAYWVPAVLLFGAMVAALSPALEDPLFPMLMFTVVGIGWVQLRRQSPVPASPALDTPTANAAPAAVVAPAAGSTPATDSASTSAGTPPATVPVQHVLDQEVELHSITRSVRGD
jgi:hypothetical protein